MKNGKRGSSWQKVCRLISLMQKSAEATFSVPCSKSKCLVYFNLDVPLLCLEGINFLCKLCLELDPQSGEGIIQVILDLQAQLGSKFMLLKLAR